METQLTASLLHLQAEELYSQKADAGLDYVPVTSSFVTLKDGDMQGSIPITVKADTIPELPEMFLVRLERVELPGGPPDNPSNMPQVHFPNLTFQHWPHIHF